jgi:hypothetical protein
MGNRNDERVCTVLNVQDCIRETPQQAAPYSRSYFYSGERVFGDYRAQALCLTRKILTESWKFLIVKGDGSGEIVSCFREEAISRHQVCFSRLLNTSLPGIEVVSPRR